MPGLAFHFEVLKQVTAALQPIDALKAQTLSNHEDFARLGAMGPDLFRYLPPDPALLDKIANDGIDALNASDLIEVTRHPLMVCYAMLFRNIVTPLWPFFAQLHDFYKQLSDIADAENAEQLKGMKQQAQDVWAQVQTMNNLPADALQFMTIARAAVLGGKPIIQTNSPLAVKQWRPYEFLRWIHSGQFARALMTLADAEPNAGTRERLQAYALGYLCHVASSVTGEPFVNNIVGGPYRTHWWRSRYVANYVDAWTHGRFNTAGASMSGDEPTPQYMDWVNLCSAKLHDEMAFAKPVLSGSDAAKAVGNGQVDTAALVALDKVAAMFAQAVNDSYSATITPDSLTADDFKRAYVGAYAVLWLMTGGEGPLCTKPPVGPPPGCTEEPSWVSGGGSPPSAEQETDGDTGCSVALAILAILAFLTGAWVAGVAAIIGAIAAAEGGMAIDWAKLRCTIYWQRQHLFEIEQAVRDALILGSLAYPMSHQLGSVGPDGTTTPSDGIEPSGHTMCRTRRSDKYPFTMDGSQGTGPDLNWSNFPTSSIEEPSTGDRQDDAKYPEFPLNGMGLLSGGMNSNGTYPTRDISFGDAVANALQIIQDDAASLPDYNLDGDRGYGWKAWRPKLGTKPNAPPVKDEPVS